jgi:transcriptional regulator with XRE-family HTH domain
MERHKAIGRRLKHEGILKYRTITKFAKVLGLPMNTLDLYLNGMKRPGVAMQNRLLEIGCDIDYILSAKTTEVQKAELQRMKENKIYVHICPPEAASPEMIIQTARWSQWFFENRNANKKIRQNMYNEMIYGVK